MSVSNLLEFNNYQVYNEIHTVGTAEASVSNTVATLPADQFQQQILFDTLSAGNKNVMTTIVDINGDTVSQSFGSESSASHANAGGSVCFAGGISDHNDCFVVGDTATSNYDGSISFSDKAVQTTVGAAGGATAIPATPSVYLRVRINEVNYVIPCFAQV